MGVCMYICPAGDRHSYPSTDHIHTPPPQPHTQVIFLCIDAATLLRAQGGDHHAAANGSNGNGKATDGGSASSSSSSSSGPGSASSAAASALGAMGLRDLLLLEVLWFALDMVSRRRGLIVL